MNRDPNRAVEQALKRSDKVNKPVLLHINFKCGLNYGHFRLNSHAFTPYPDEHEVLLDDGLQVRVVGVDSKFKY